MKAPRLRILAITAAAAAMATGLTATAASAATAHAVSSAVAAAPAAAAAAGKLTSTVTGTFTNADGQGTFAGTFTPQKFSVANGVLEATGLLKGTMTDANGTRLGTVSQTVTMPAAANLLRRAHDILPAEAPERFAIAPDLGEALMQIGEFPAAVLMICLAGFITSRDMTSATRSLRPAGRTAETTSPVPAEAARQTASPARLAESSATRTATPVPAAAKCKDWAVTVTASCLARLSMPRTFLVPGLRPLLPCPGPGTPKFDYRLKAGMRL